MELKTISRVSTDFGISTRTLRYYEQIGLLKSRRMDGYAYRVYDEDTLIRLKEIIILRKLRIPLKQIGTILQNHDAVIAINVFRQTVGDLNTEITALSTIRSILTTLINRLQEKTEFKFRTDILDDQVILQVIESLIPITIKFQEGNSMEDLQKANQRLSKLNDVRIVYLPPEIVAASHFIGNDPEKNAAQPLDRFVRESGLSKLKPDLRHYGFNHPNPAKDRDIYGYEMWVTIPDDMEVPQPLVRKRFEGGLYAAHMIQMGNFHEWDWLMEWANASPDYAPNLINDNGECMYGLLEEHLNYINHVAMDDTEPEGMQLDLLLPVKTRED